MQRMLSKECKNISKTDFTSPVTKETHKINQKLNCDDKYLVYFLACKKCFKQ